VPARVAVNRRFEEGEAQMYVYEDIALRMAKERLAEAIRRAEQQRAIRDAGSRTPARVRLGRSLVRLGHWISGQPAPAFS
jgi:hypothetical protein